MENQKTFHALHLTHNDSDAMGCDVLLKCFLSGINIHTAYGIAGKGDIAFKKLWYDYFEIEEETSDTEFLKRLVIFTERKEKLSKLKYIFITDISISDELAIYLKGIVNEMNEKGYDVKLIGVDHHITNTMPKISDCFMVSEKVYLEGVYEGLSPLEIKDDMLTPVSATFLLYHYLLKTWKENNFEEYCGKWGISVMKKNILHWMSCIISEYDTWEWRNHPESVIRFALTQSMSQMIQVDHKEVPADTFKKVIDIIGIEHAVDVMVDFVNNCKQLKTTEVTVLQIIPELFKNINAVNSMQEDLLVDKFFNSPKLHICDYEGEEYIYAMFINENQFSNRICEEVYNRYKFVDFVIVMYPSTGQIGFRTNHSDINVGRIASRLFGGGGHPSAAGAHLSTEEMMEFLQIYFNSPSVKDYLSGKEVNV